MLRPCLTSSKWQGIEKCQRQRPKFLILRRYGATTKHKKRNTSIEVHWRNEMKIRDGEEKLSNAHLLGRLPVPNLHWTEKLQPNSTSLYFQARIPTFPANSRNVLFFLAPEKLGIPITVKVR